MKLWAFVFAACALLYSSQSTPVDNNVNSSVVTGNGNGTEVVPALGVGGRGTCEMYKARNASYCNKYACAMRYEGQAHEPGYCDHSAPHGWCTQFRMRGNDSRIACWSCACRNTQRKERPNGKTKIVGSHGGGRIFHEINSRQVDDSISIGQYVSVHSVDHVVDPLTDWTTNGFWSFGEVDEVYRRDQDDNLSIVTTSHDLVSVTYKHTPGIQHPGLLKARAGGRILSPTDLHYEVSGTYSKDGVPHSVNMTFAGPDKTKRNDWSQFNVQYWASSGSQWTELERDVINWHYRNSMNNDADSEGFCSMLVDDYAYWATIKMWTGNSGYGSLGDCPCVSSAFPGVEGPECGGEGEYSLDFESS